MTGPRQPSLATAALGGLVAALVAAEAGGAVLTQPEASVAACAAILALGLPHGALDWDRLRAADGHRAFLQALGAYVLLAGAAALTWLISPALALCAFLVASVVHFAEDWRGAGRLLAFATGAAIVASPAVFHAGQVEVLFAMLASPDSAAFIAGVARVTAALALPAAAAGFAIHWCAGDRDRALAGSLGLAALLILPPLIGFALFFCLCHAPQQVRVLPGWSAGAVGATGGGLLLALALYLARDGGEASDRLAAASFMALSILLVPHMLAPYLIARSPLGVHATIGRAD